MRFFAVIFLVLASVAQVFAGANDGKEGNGGNLVALDFTQKALRAVEVLERHRDLLPADFKQIDTAELRDALSSTRLEVVENICANEVVPGSGSCLVALNFPGKKLIRISAAAWTKQSSNLEFQVAIALHEFLGIIGIEKNLYYISAQLSPYVSGRNRLALLRMGTYELDGQSDSSAINYLGCALEVFSVDDVGLRILGRLVNGHDSARCSRRAGEILEFKCDSITAQDCQASGALFHQKCTASSDCPVESSTLSVDQQGRILYVAKKSGFHRFDPIRATLVFGRN